MNSLSEITLQLRELVNAAKEETGRPGSELILAITIDWAIKIMPDVEARYIKERQPRAGDPRPSPLTLLGYAPWGLFGLGRLIVTPSIPAAMGATCLLADKVDLKDVPGCLGK